MDAHEQPAQRPPTPPRRYPQRPTGAAHLGRARIIADDLARQRTALTADLEKQRETLTTVQHQLAGSRKPRWGAKRVAELASLLTVSTEDLCAVWWEHKPLGAIQVRVEEKLRQIEAEMANPDATLRQRRDLKLKHLLSWAKRG